MFSKKEKEEILYLMSAHMFDEISYFVSQIIPNERKIKRGQINDRKRNNKMSRMSIF